MEAKLLHPMRPPRCSQSAILATGALLLLASPGAGHALLVYSATGGSISGSLGNVTFSEASWSLTATADETMATSTTLPSGMGPFNFRWLPVSPRLKIETVAGMLEADLLPSGPFRWLALSGTFPVGPTPKIGFVYTTTNFRPEKAAGVFGVADSFVSLQSPIHFSGDSVFEVNTYPSTQGDLVITNSPTTPGTFRIEPTPGPLSVMAVVGAFSWSRRLRTRRAQLQPSTETR
jgi:hypothetical protein